MEIIMNCNNNIIMGGCRPGWSDELVVIMITDAMMMMVMMFCKWKTWARLNLYA